MEPTSVRIPSDGLELAGDLRMPVDSPLAIDGRVPAVAITGPLSAVKDQVSGTYADHLTKAGFATVAFDHRNFGGSGGEPRQHEDPAGKVDDLRDVVSWMRAQEGVDPDRIALLGVCLGASYVLKAAAFDPRVRAVAGVGGSYNSPVIMKLAYGAEVYRQQLAGQIQALEAEYASGEMAYLPVVNQQGFSLLFGEEPYEYYGTDRAKSAVWENRMTARSWRELLMLDVVPAAEMLEDTPLLIVHGKKDAYLPPEAAQALFDRAAGEKEIMWLDTEKHIDLYDQPEFVDPAADRVAGFFAKHLQPATAAVGG